STFDNVREELTKAIQFVEPFAEHGSKIDSAQGMAAAFVEQLRKRSHEIDRVFERQRAELGSVNFAIFGRTGVGKSSLIEAMTHGDGGTVSLGESDWTTQVR